MGGFRRVVKKPEKMYVMQYAQIIFPLPPFDFSGAVATVSQPGQVLQQAGRTTEDKVSVF